MKAPPANSDCNSDLSQWHHCTDSKHVPDQVLKTAWNKSIISFVFYHYSHEKQIKTV